MSTSDVCGVVAKMFFLGKPTRWQAVVLRFQRRDWTSLYGLSFNLAALVRLCCHAVRYFHPPMRFLNGETASQTFHISDFCRGRSRIVPGITYPRISAAACISPVQFIQYHDSDKNLGELTVRHKLFLRYSLLDESSGHWKIWGDVTQKTLREFFSILLPVILFKHKKKKEIFHAFLWL